MATGVDPDSQSGKILDRLGHALDNGGDTLGKHTKTALNKLNDIVNQDGQKDDSQNLSQTGNNGEKRPDDTKLYAHCPKRKNR